MLKKFITLPLFCALITACGTDSNNSSPRAHGVNLSGEIDSVQNTLAAIMVADVRGNPIAGATVMIGTAPNQPFANNIATTDSSGGFTPMRDWNTPLPVTISAKGFVRTTFMSQLPNQKSFAIRTVAPAVKPELNGVTTGFGTLVKDGFVDVGIVIPALTRADLGSFQASTLLSPENDVIKIVGKTSYLPSNITLPAQSESIFPVTVKLDKPIYRMFFDRRASYKVVSAHVKFPLKKVVQDSQDGKSGVELVNHFTFLQAGIANTVISADKQTLNLPVNQLQFNSTIVAQAPTIRATQTVLAVALVKDGDQLYPTDIKNLVSKETRNLSFPASATGYVLGVLREELKKRTGAITDFMSVSLKTIDPSDALEFLSLIEAPKIVNGTLILRPPSILPNLKGVATTATLSAVEIKTVGKSVYEIKKPEWDIYAPTWVTEISLPTMPLEIASPPPAKQMRWEAVFMATPQASSSTALGPELMNSVTHLTRSAVDL